MRIAGIVLLVVVLVGIGAIGLSSFVNGRDSASVHTQEGPGVARDQEPALGDAADVGTPGNVVLLYSARADAPALQSLADDVAGPSSPELESAGQAVIVRRDPTAKGIVAVSEDRVQRAQRADAAELRAFVEAWLGRAE
ncbi:MAG: hypothetical protein JHC95_05630 [Solirubrobacteraceae bacterium]|nr:hypothetical protein [Solirubrobacteraceae bacterium]